MNSIIYFSEERFLKLTLEEIKAFGKDVNRIRVDGKFLIFYLIKKNKIELIENLINELDTNIENGRGYSPLFEACCRNNFKIVKLLIERGKYINFDMVGLLVGKGTYINCQIEYRYRSIPLYWSCQHENFEMTKFLLENGVIPYVDEEGNYECLEDVDEGENKEKLKNFIFQIQSQNIKKS